MISEGGFYVLAGLLAARRVCRGAVEPAAIPRRRQHRRSVHPRPRVGIGSVNGPATAGRLTFMVRPASAAAFWNWPICARASLVKPPPASSAWLVARGRPDRVCGEYGWSPRLGCRRLVGRARRARARLSCRERPRRRDRGGPAVASRTYPRARHRPLAAQPVARSLWRGIIGRLCDRGNRAGRGDDDDIAEFLALMRKFERRDPSQTWNAPDGILRDAETSTLRCQKYLCECY